MDSEVTELTWRRNKSATDVTIVVQTSSDLASWTTESPENTVLTDDGQVQMIRSRIPRSGQRQYVRMEVLLP
jgi:hypothetical protein